MSRIAIISDTLPTQTNGVVRSMDAVLSRLERDGHVVEVISLRPDRHSFPTFYPGVRLQFFQNRRIARELDAFKPDLIHIVTEGLMGLAGRAYCLKNNHAFTTALHTKFDEYIPGYFKPWVGEKTAAMMGRMTARYMRWFHGPSSAVMVATQVLRDELALKGFRRLARWSRGVDLQQFRLLNEEITSRPSLSDPIFFSHGRVTAEKNLRAFLSQVSGRKKVIGDGPQIDELRREFPDVEFTGVRKGEALNEEIAGCSVFVFASTTDTFGLVLLEALACGKPVAAFDTPTNQEVLGRLGANVACLDADLATAAKGATDLLASGAFDPVEVRRRIAETYSWDASAREFYRNLCANTEPRRRRMRYLKRLSRPPQPLRAIWRDRAPRV